MQLQRQLGVSEGPVCYAELLIVHNVVDVVCSVIHIVMEDRGVRVGKAHSFGLLQSSRWLGLGVIASQSGCVVAGEAA